MGIVGGADDGDMQGADVLHNLPGALGVDAGERLVQQDEGPAPGVGQTACQRQTAAHPAGHFLRQGVRLGSQICRGQPRQRVCPQRQHNADLGSGIEAGQQTILLKEDGCLGGRRGGDDAVCRLLQTGQQAEQSRLAAAGGAAECSNTAAGQCQREVLQHGAVTVREADVLQYNAGGCHILSPPLPVGRPASRRRITRSTSSESTMTVMVQAKSAGVSR